MNHYIRYLKLRRERRIDCKGEERSSECSIRNERSLQSEIRTSGDENALSKKPGEIETMQGTFQ